MAYDIRFVKLTSGETILGKYTEEGGNPRLTDVAVLQTIPAQQGVQIMLLPFGYPFDMEFDAEIDYKYVIYQYKSLSSDIENKYLEAVSNITLAGAGSLGDSSQIGQGISDISKLLKK